MCTRFLLFAAIFTAASSSARAGDLAAPIRQPSMKWGDIERRHVPFAKDPSVIWFGSRYLLYYSIPPFGDRRKNDGWAIGIAASTDLVRWSRVGQILPEQPYEQKGLVNGRVILLGGRLHLFYNSYGNGPRDAICHAVSFDGLHFTRNPDNPIVRAKGAWNNGRAIDCDVVVFHRKLWLYFATRDPTGQTQMLTAATADLQSNLGPQAWTQATEGPILRPELPWETRCIEAPSLVARQNMLYLFYGGGYNNDPQQIGCARSSDGIHWIRLFHQPLLPNGQAGAWNSSESGHPGWFQAPSGQEYLFFQGNNDHGRTWYLSWVKLGWKNNTPYIY